MMRILVFLFLFSTIGCQTEPKSSGSKNTEVQLPKAPNNSESLVTLSYEASKIYPTNNPVQISYKTTVNESLDSIRLAVDGLYRTTFFKTENYVLWETVDELPGTRSVMLTFYWNNTIQKSVVISIPLVSDFNPINYSYKVKNKWPHSNKAYTQGLEFSDGFLYEGTGQYGESMLFKIDLQKNEIVQSLNLPSDVFGEGITILSDKIFQLTWRSNLGYVYGKSTFNRLYEFNYPTEGWGLCNNGKELIMSDGTETIYFLDAEYFQEIRKIQVYNDKGPVKNLNELEYINGEIYANIYGSDLIVAIDPEKGKVKKQIDLSGILDKSKVKDPIDVLNGIAWNANTKQLIVTGKWWPEFFEIELVEKK